MEASAPASKPGVVVLSGTPPKKEGDKASKKDGELPKKDGEKSDDSKQDPKGGVTRTAKVITYFREKAGCKIDAKN